MKRFTSSLLLAVALTLTFAAPRAQANATQAVLYAGGYADGTAEAQLRTEEARVQAVTTGALPTPLPFRLMAAIARSLANLFAQIGAPTGEAYMLGRADAFDAAADYAGEPR